MQTLFSHLPSLLRISGRASVVILLVLAARWLCGRRLQPRWRCALWLLVLLRLALPWTIPSPASVFNVLKMPASAPEARAEASPTPVPDAPVGKSERGAVPASSAATHWLAWLWAAGALCLVGCTVVNNHRILRRVIRQRPLLDGPTLNLLEDCKSLMGVTTPVTLIETETIASPTLFGFVRPRLLLPVGLAARFTREELRHVFLHELAHIKRHDIVVGWVMLGLQTVHWFNPLVWLGFHCLRADRELACDALALSYARPGDNEAYGLTIVKLLEGFGQSVWTPSLAGILENKQQIKERISMIAKFHKSERGLALALSLLTGLALVTLTDAQTPSQKPVGAQASKGGDWNLDQKLQMAQGGNQWAAYELWDAYYRGHHGVDTDSAKADKWLGEVIKDVWVVRFEPVDNFAPKNPGEFLQRIHEHYSGHSGKNNIGAASFFRTTQQGDKLVGSFLSSSPDELKAGLAQVPGIKVTTVERITPETFIAYDQSQQESLWNLEEKVKLAESGNQWAAYDLWDAYHRGHHGMDTDSAKAGKWLAKVAENTWVVKFEPVDDFAPKNAGEFLARIHEHSSSSSGKNNIGAASFFRTTKQGDKLVGSFLSNYPNELKASLAHVPGVKVTSVERMSAGDFIKYDESQQESL
jgi:beta-lactamase regulating signal transducer with metallopeptidase domain